MAQSFPELFVAQIEAAPENAEALIEAFVAQKRAEDLHLEFKQKHDATKALLADTDKGRLSKAMSSFANSDGGLIVCGVIAKGTNDPEVSDVAEALAPISNIDAFHSNLNELISYAINTRLPGARNLKVLCRTDASKGYVVTYVPAGEIPPYRAEFANKQYFKRSNNQSYPMEPFDIRDLVARGRYPKIVINAGLVHIPSRIGLGFFDFVFSIRNEGPSALESWKLVLEYSNAIVLGGQVDGLRNRSQTGVQFIGPDNGQWWRSEFWSVNLGDRAVYPEDESVIISQTADTNLSYVFAIHEHSVARTGRPINWRFYGWNIPSQEGSILLNGKLVNQLLGRSVFN